MSGTEEPQATAGLRPGRPIVLANLVLAGLIVVAVLVFGFFGLINDPTGNGSAAGSRVNASTRIRDRQADPKPLTVNEVFPQPTYKVRDHQYILLTKENTQPCDKAARGDRLIQALATYECSQVVRGTIKDPSGQYVATLGIANLADAPGAAEVDSLLQDPENNGAFPLQSVAAVDSSIQSRKKVVDHERQGHYVLFVTVVKLNVSDYDTQEPAITSMLQDGLARLSDVVKARESDG